MKANAAIIEKITNAAVENMVRRANIEITGTYQAKAVGAADIWAAVVADPTGNTAFRLAELVVLGIGTYEVMA